MKKRIIVLDPLIKYSLFLERLIALVIIKQLKEASNKLEQVEENFGD